MVGCLQCAWSSKRFTCFYSLKYCKVSTKVDTKIQINILRLREVKLVAQDHILTNWGTKIPVNL